MDESHWENKVVGSGGMADGDICSRDGCEGCVVVEEEGVEGFFVASVEEEEEEEASAEEEEEEEEEG